MQMAPQTRFYKYIIPIVRGLGHLFFRISVKGKDNIPSEGPVVVVSNHMDNIDPALLTVVYPTQIVFLAKKEILEHAPGWVGAGFNAYGTIFIDRGKITKTSLNSALQYLSKGGTIGIFPEGTRSLKGQLLKGQPGAAFLAIESKASIQPVAIIGSNEYKINIRSLFRRPLLTVIFGKPIVVNKKDIEDIGINDLSEKIMNSIADLLPEGMRGAYYRPD